MFGKRKQAESTLLGDAAGPESLAGPESPASQPRRVTPVDIQQKEFRLAFRGYNERDVDQFLDEVTEEVARLHADNKRLREDASSAGTMRLDTAQAGEADAVLQQARGQAEEMLRQARTRADNLLQQARADAARITGEARTEGPAPAAAQPAAGPGGSAAHPSQAMVRAFLVREREFLQSLAGLIQGHAQSVKEDISRNRTPTAAAGSAQPAPGPGNASSESASWAAGPSSSAASSPPASSSAAWAVDEAEAGEGGDQPKTEVWRPSFGDESGRPEGRSPDESPPVGEAATPKSAEAGEESQPRTVGTVTVPEPPSPGDERSPTEDVIDLTEAESGEARTIEHPGAAEGGQTDGRRFQESSPQRRAPSFAERRRADPQDGESDDSSEVSLRELFWGED